MLGKQEKKGNSMIAKERICAECIERAYKIKKMQTRTDQC